MLMQWAKIFFIMTSLLAISEAIAKVSPEEADKLGKELTPHGAIRAGNAEGTIPEWTGGLHDDNAHDKWNQPKDPYPDDKILFTITGQNADQYKDKLTAGQYALLKKYSTYKMNIYQTRRTVHYPDWVNEAIKRNALNAELYDNGNAVRNSEVAHPFPIPKNGHELVFNSRLSYNTPLWQGETMSGQPLESGSWTLGSSQGILYMPYHMKGQTTDSVNNVILFANSVSVAPAASTGNRSVVISYCNNTPRTIWSYSAASRRVTRVTDAEFDAPGSDGQSWDDLNWGFRGRLEKFDFKLVGKKEVYIPYNNYRLIDRSVPFSKIVKQHHLNPDYIRYELHRVWVMEMTLKPGQKHISPKRTVYMDEDLNWFVEADAYDTKGNLWRVVEIFSVWDYKLDSPHGGVLRTQAVYDLLNGRYSFNDFTNDSKVPITTSTEVIDEKLFTPAALQGAGR